LLPIALLSFGLAHIAQGAITLSVASLSFSSTAGSVPPTQPVTILNTYGAILVIAAPTVPWISVSPSVVAAGGQITVRVNPAGLSGKQVDRSTSIRAEVPASALCFR